VGLGRLPQGRQWHLPQENKSKGEINELQIKRELPYDLQTMLYLTALAIHIPKSNWKGHLVKGVRYNVVKRPLSKGKHCITQLKGRGKAKVGAETPEQFYKRLADEHIAAYPKDFFCRFRMETTPGDLASFQQQCLNPILEQLCDWWNSIENDPFNPWTDTSEVDEGKARPNHHHFRFPYGVYNTALEGREGVLDEFLATGSETGLTRVTELFPELQGTAV